MIDELLDERLGKDKKIFLIGFLLFALLLLIIHGIKLYEAKKCQDSGGIYMEDKSCFMPESEEQRQDIIDKGYYERPPLYRINLTGIVIG